MKLKHLFLLLAITAGLAGAAFFAEKEENSGGRMTTAAEKFLASLKPAQKAKASFKFDDSERTNWYFTPQQKNKKALRKGLPLEDMTKEQQTLALDVLKAATSEAGYKKATTVMSLEAILADLEKKGSMVRRPDWYFVSVFGSPSKTGKWGFRFEGHHLSLNFTIDKGKLVSSTPCMYGANPAVVKAGKQKGLTPLPEAEEPFRALLKLLENDQLKLAKQKTLHKEIEEAKSKPNVGKPVGLPASKMNAKQKAALQKLIDGYAARMAPEVAAVELAKVKKAGLDKVYFSYAGGDGTPGVRYTYRVQGPTFVIEFLNEQKDSAGNVANHIHSAWRNIKGDFGLDAE